MKKLVSVLLVLVMLFSAAALAESEAPLAGGWQIGESANEEVMKAYDKAFEGFVGASYEPQLLIATQLVAGTNYCFLCKETTVTAEPVTGWALVYIYVDLEGNAQLLRIQNFDFLNPELAGGFNMFEGELDEAASEAIQNAIYTGEETFECYAVLGQQVVAGRNFKLLCVRADENGLIPAWALVTVYVDLGGNGQIIDVEDIELSITEPNAEEADAE